MVLSIPTWRAEFCTQGIAGSQLQFEAMWPPASLIKTWSNEEHFQDINITQAKELDTEMIQLILEKVLL